MVLPCLSLVQLSIANIARIRLVSMFAVLVLALFCGYVSANFLGVSEKWAKRIMTAVLVSLNWAVALLVIWKIQLTKGMLWLPVTSVFVLLISVAFSVAIFSFFRVEKKTRLTLIMAAALSNLGYTGGAFVCYALFGTHALGLAHIYILTWMPVAYLIFFPWIIRYEHTLKNPTAKFSKKQLLDPRALAIPAVAIAIMLNLANVKRPVLIDRLYIVDIFVYVASALSFFAIGLRLKISRLRDYTKFYFPVAAVKFVITPVVAAILIWLLSVSGQNLTTLEKKVIIVLSFCPTAVLMVTLSNAYDLNARLASALWVVITIVFAVIVVPLLFVMFA